jgi:hypothetical protein
MINNDSPHLVSAQKQVFTPYFHSVFIAMQEGYYFFNNKIIEGVCP